MPPKPRTGPPPSGGLFNFFAKAPSGATPQRSVFDDDEFNTNPPNQPSSSTTTTPTKPSLSTPIKSTITPSTTTTSTSSATTTPVKSITSPAAVKQARSVYDDGSDHDDVIIKRPAPNPTVPKQTPIKSTAITTPTKSTPVKTNDDNSTSEEDIIIKKKTSKYDESASSGYSDDDGSSDDYTSDSDSQSDDGSESFVSESEDDRSKKRQTTKKTRPKSSTSRGNKRSSVPADNSDIAMFTDSDSDDDNAKMDTDLIQNNENPSLLFQKFVNTGVNRAAPVASLSTTSKDSINRPLLDQINTLSALNDDDDDDDNDDTKNNKNDQKTGTKTLSSAIGDYELPVFVLPENIKDKQGRRPNHPEYNPRTLLIPPAEFKGMTPAQQQFWQTKSDNMDVVMFFKVGKFYELFDLDAEVGVQELGLARMGSDKRLHVGFPEAAYLKYAKILVQRGHRVACVEQIQTPEQMKEYNDRLPRGQPKQKIVNRAICSLVTPGTGVSDEFLAKPNTFLLALTEYQIVKTQATTVNAGGDVTFNRVSYNDRDCIYGIAYVDTATGAFHVGSFIDNTNKTSLKALLAQIQPAEVIYSNNSLSTNTNNILSTELPPNCLHTPLHHTQTMSSTNCIAKLSTYFKPYIQRKQAGTAKRLNPNNIDVATGWPKVLFKYKLGTESLDEESDSLPQAQFDEKFQLYETFWSSLGLLYLYLQRTLLDQELFPLCRFKLYTPIEQTPTQMPQITSNTTTSTNTNTEMSNDQSKIQKDALNSLPDVNFDCENDNLILDAQTLTNLEILTNGDGGNVGTLLHYLDHCQTSFGKRLLQRWVVAPLFKVEDINARLDAVGELLNHYDIVQSVSKKFAKVPDLERMLARIRANGIKKQIEPVMYENIGKAKVDLFLKCLDGFELALKAVFDLLNNTANHEWDAPLLKELLFTAKNGQNGGKNDKNDENGDEDDDENLFFTVHQLLDEFRSSFDHKKAREDGHITPKQGIVDAFDDANEQLHNCEAKLNQLLTKYRSKFGGNTSIIWAHKNRETFQLEIPINLVEKYSSIIDNSFEQVSSTAKLRRYYTPEIKAAAKAYEDAKDDCTEILKDVTRQVFEKFSQDYHIWSSVLDSLSNIDCLLSLAMASKISGGATTCRPNVIPIEQSPTKKPMLEMRNAVHPTVAKASSFGAYVGAPKTYIPNDVDIGTEVNPSRFVIVSGPNMGGKSTLLRQVCCCIILAQIGCYVPAEAMTLTPIDRIFTRVGASDRIIQGQSTFLVELEETSHILRHATPRSFVILDELGRGTSTFDGTAIAHSVVQYLSQNIQCMTLFTTHYHMLLQEYRNNPLVSMYHMAYKVNTVTENDDNNNDNNKKSKQHLQSITFLYKFLKGVCNKSFGLHVATLAKLPGLVIDVAYERGEWFSASFEQSDETQCNKLLKRSIVALYHNDFNTLRQIRNEFQQIKSNQ